MSDPNQAFQQKLLAIFAAEAREHLQQLDAGLLALEQAGAGARAALLQPILKTLHTLKGAARAVDLGHLERLCHALEGVCSAAAAAPAALDPAGFDRLHAAVACARELIGAPTGRARNQTAALCGQLDQLAGQLAGGADASAAAGPEPDPAPPPAAPPAAAPLPARARVRRERPEEALPQLVRVNAGQLDAIRTEVEALLAAELSMQHQVGELRALAGALSEQRRAAESRAGSESGATAAELQCARLAQELGGTCASLGATRNRLMGAILETALVPFAAALDELPALVRNLARSREREVALRMAGASLQVDRRILGVIREALIHLVTNAVDHGIEPPAARVAAGKRATGTVQVAVTQRDARQLLVRVSDDGAGIDVGALARASGVDAGEFERLGGRQRLELALRAGVSTRAEVTQVSGRGMGLAIVAEKVAAVGGELAIDSTPGQGATFELLLPVSLASLRALVVTAGALRYVVPLPGLESVRSLAPGDIGTVENRETVVVAGRVLPLVRLAALFGAAPAAPGPGQGCGVALVAGTARPFALLVDAIVAEQDVLPRRLGPLLRRVRYFTGAAQLGDGALVPVIGLDDIAAHALGGAAPPAAVAASAGARPAARVLVVEDSITSRLLLKHILEGAGCEVETAADGLEALSRLRQGRFDAVVSDVEMPHLDGLGLTAAIRADPKTAELPVILVTSLQTPAERERGLHAGADAYLTKGAFDQDQLLAALRRLT